MQFLFPKTADGGVPFNVIFFFCYWYANFETNDIKLVQKANVLLTDYITAPDFFFLISLTNVDNCLITVYFLAYVLYIILDSMCKIFHRQEVIQINWNTLSENKNT